MRYHCSSCRKLGHNRTTCPSPRTDGKFFFRGRWRDANEAPREHQYLGLDEYILKHLGRVGQTSRELYQRVVNDYGPVGERTFLRHLRALRAEQQLTAIERPFAGGYLYAA